MDNSANSIETSPWTLGTLFAQARRGLLEAGVEEPGLEARLFLRHLAAADPVETIASPGRPVAAGVARAVLEAVARREDRVPLHRILGFREFYGLKLALSPATLEPRPDTETLVDLVLPRLRRTVQARGGCHILDLGTGTGALALALLSQAPEATALGVDISAEALASAAANANMHGLGGRFSTRLCDWLSDVGGRFDLIVTNPPYIRTDELAGLDREVREHDPAIALDGGPDGLDFYRRTAAEARPRVERDGAVAVETGVCQRSSVEAIFRRFGFHLEAAAQDLAGRDRALIFS